MQRKILIALLVFEGILAAQPKAWITFAHDSQHSAQSSITAQNLDRIVWQTPVDLDPQYSGNELLIHYGSPVITGLNTVIVPVKTGATGGFRVDGRQASDGGLLWSATSDYILPTHDWTPVFGPTLAAKPTPRVYYPGVGGTVYYRDFPDSASGSSGQIAFFGTANYQANPSAYNQNVFINTPILSDSSGNLFFGFLVTGTTPVPLRSGIARISASGQGSWVSVESVSGDSAMTHVVYNCAPALSPDLSTLYAAVSDGFYGYLVSMNASTLAPLAHRLLLDPKSGDKASLNDDGSASPTVGPDGDVYYGVLETPFGENNDRGWMLHFNSTLSQLKTPGAFGWDDTASIVPVTMVPSYHGSSPYLLMTKYNNYLGIGTGNGANKIAILDPDATEVDPVTGITVMNEVLTMIGQTPDGPPPSVKEWCINSAAIDPSTNAVFAGSEDGRLYRWDLATNTLTQKIVLTSGIGEAYTPTVVGPNGFVYAINNATLFAIGN
jgi:hypothetical protein